MIKQITYAMLLFFLFSCTEEKDLKQREVAPEATTGHVVLTPQWGAGAQAMALRYCFYPASGSAIYADGSAAGFEGDLPVGTYRLIAYNAGATDVRFAGTDRYGTAAVELTAVDAATRGGMTLVNQAAEVYSATLADGLAVTAGGNAEAGAKVRNLMCKLRFNFTVGSGLEPERLDCTLPGVYPSVLLSTGEPTATAVQAAPRVAVPFEVDWQTRTEGVAEVRVPGLLDPQNGTVYNNVLSLDMETTTGEHWTSEVDLNGVLTQILADNGGTLPVEVPVELDIRIERTALGMTATVSGWQTGEWQEEVIH